MASTGTAITLTLGAALAGGWASTFYKAQGDVSLLGAAIAKAKQEQKSLGVPDYAGHEKNSAALTAARKALDDYNATLSGSGAPTEEQSAILGHLTKQHEKAQKTYNASKKGIQDRVIALKAEGKDVEALTRRHDQLSRRIEKQIALGAAWGKAKGNLTSFGKTLGAGIGIISAATAASYKFVNATAAEGEALENSSARIGVAVSALQELNFVADRSNLGAANLEKGFDHLGQGLDDAIVKRSGPVHDALTRLRMDARAIATMPADERLNAIADALANITDENARASITADLFGKEAGRGFNTMLAGGSKGLGAGRADARASGAVWDTKGAQDYQNSLTALKSSWSSLGRIVGAQLMPAFTRLNKTIGEAITGNGGQVGKAVAALADVFVNLVPVLGGAAKFAASFFGVLGKSPWMVKALAGFIGALGVAIAAVKFVGVIQGVLALGSALIGFIPAVWSLTTALLACPVTWIVIGLVAIGAAIYFLWKKWDTINAWFDAHPFLGAIISAAFPIIGAIRAVIKVVNFFKENWSTITDVVGQVWDVLKRVFSWSPIGLVIRAYGAVFTWLENKLAIFTKIGNAVKWAWSKISSSGGESDITADVAAASIDTSIPLTRGGSKTVTNSIGKIEIHAPPGLDAEQVASLAAQRIQEKQAAMIDGAFADSTA